ncbi:hypothetical protein MMC11_009109 [Xylographa trunciseda]|nr:hypothetical protein [Xylographa trunciseda]
MIFGLETLVHNVGRQEACVDIVAVHGLEEDRTEAWTCTETRTLWLRDLLPFNILPARVLTFGYDAGVSSFFGSGSADSIQKHAHTLIAELEANRALDNAAEKPIIFVCHGLGGLVVKKALAYSASRTSKKVEHLYSIFISTYAVLFLGTPHSGVEKASWALTGMHASGDLERSIEKNSETLQNITDQFAPLMKQFHLYFFWETVQTADSFKRYFVVSEESAAPILDDTERSGINATHAQMCRFGSIESPGYSIVLAALLRYAKESHTTISLRWMEARKFLATQRTNEASELVGFDVRNDNKPFNYRNQEVPKIQNKYFRIPHNVSNIYTGRDTFTRGLREKMLVPTPSLGVRRQRRFVLFGLGGSGKTQFCLKFVQENRDNYYGIFFIDASSVENAERAFAELGRLGGMGDTCTNGMYWLTGLEFPWLLVIDNADDPSVDYSRFFPPGERGHILITSRNQDCKIHATIGYYEFKDMEQEDAITLLLKAACVEDSTERKVRDLARPIAKTLGYLPLALIQAGASIRQNICSLEDYLELYSSHRKEIFSKLPVQGADQYKYTIFTTWEVSFRMIEQQATEEAADAIEVLHIFAFLHFEQVPATMFQRAWNNLHDVNVPNQESSESLSKQLFNWSSLTNLFTYIFGKAPITDMTGDSIQLPRLLQAKNVRWDGYRLRQALATLCTFSLIYKDSNTDTYSTHPMVNFWARDRLEKTDQQLWSQIAITTLALSISNRGWRSDHTFRRSLAPHIDACLHGAHTEPLLATTAQSAVSTATKFATIYSECGRWKEAAALQSKVLDLQKKAWGPKHVRSLQAMTDLSWSYWNLGLIPKALRLQIEVMKTSLEALGPEDPRTLKAMDDLASTYWLCGKLSESEDLGKRAMIGMSKVLGSGHPDTLMAMHNLGRTYMHRGRPKDAVELQMEVLGARQKMLGSDDLDTLMTLQGLGMSYHALKRFDEAEKILVVVLEARKRILGQEHAYTLWAINDLAKIQCAQSRPVEAEEILIRILDVVERTLGKEHIGMLMTKHNLARAYIGQSRWAEANTLLTELVGVQTRMVGPDHPDTLYAQSELARTYRHLGQVDQAERLYVEVIPKMKVKVGAENPQTLSAIGQLAAIYTEKRRFSEADMLGNEVLNAGQGVSRLVVTHARTF